VLLATGSAPNSSIDLSFQPYEIDGDTLNNDNSAPLHYPFHDNYSDPINSRANESPLYLGDPSNIKTTINYNPEERQYDIDQKIGEQFFRSPSYMTFEEYKDSEFKKSTLNYWKQKANEDNVAQRKSGFSPRLYVGGEAFNRIFGGNTIDIRPQGSASLSFGLAFSKYDNPTLPEKQRKNTSFDFKEKIQMNVIGNIGEKLKLTTNYNTEASFDFENQIKLEYTGYEDEIIQKIEAGNVTLPLNTTLIQGSQSLFGLKTQLKFGKLTVTTLLSQQKGKNSNIEVKGGATKTDFDISADQYEGNKHFFIADYFKDNYDKALKDLPFINSSVNISKVEIWVTNKNNSTDNTRSILALLDIGEPNFYNTSVPTLISLNPNPLYTTYPNDSANTLYENLSANTQLRDVNTVQNAITSIPGISASKDYEVVQNARRLNPNEYTFNARLGYVSLNQALNSNEVLAVAYEYTIGNQVFRVGDLTTSGIEPPNVLYMKMLKGRVTNTKLPTWDLMMKNIYALGGFQIDKKDFKLNVLYNKVDTTAVRINYLPVPPSETAVSGILLTQLFNLDRLNSNNDPRPDGEYDFIEGVTINTQNGRIIFPVREPFSSFLREKLIDPAQEDYYAYDVLYDSTKTVALQSPEKNKFSLKGSYSSKFGSDIPLNAINIPEGSVKVTAGGIPLVENVQYTVDYNLGRVKIIDQGLLNSGTAINISLESNSLFSIQSKTLYGSRFDYVVNKDLILGGTIMRLNERPITQKVNIGDEPIANTIWGVDGSWRTQSRWLTKMIDKLPGISTKEPSSITVSGEFANIIPGNNKAIGKNGTAYIDDFEGSQSTIDLKNTSSWILSSTPSNLFQEGASTTLNLDYGFNRAKLAWYVIDQMFYRNISGLTPPNITDAQLSDDRVRQVNENELFPNKQNPNGQVNLLSVLNLSYYPEERGPYNYNVAPTANSAGVAADGKLNNPASRWGGIMRRVETTDFDAANVEFIQFWMMDPFQSNPQNSNGGKLYFNLGNVSEDILKDGKLEYENGLPINGDSALANSTIWGYTPKTQPPIIYAFDNNSSSRQYQDVGYDGLRNEQESTFFSQYVTDLKNNVSTQASNEALLDISSDNFHYYRGSDLDASNAGILDRYKNYSMPDGNSPTEQQSPETYSTASTTTPDFEDVNRDFNQEGSEQFYEYRVDIDQNQMQIGTNYIVDKIIAPVSLKNGTNELMTWYQFKIPIKEIDGSRAKKIGEIEGYNNISFIRMFMTGFDAPMVLRFGKLEFLRGEWRKYSYTLFNPAECLGCGSANTTFDITTVSLEENGRRTPINYVLPPGINREINTNSTTLQQLNEQSLALKVCELEDGDARGAFKTLSLDIRSYKTLKMYIHAESAGTSDALRNGDVTAFVRMGTDFSENYYEYELPLKITPWGTTSPDVIWPSENELDLELDRFVALKLARNKAISNSGGSLNISSLYSEAYGNNRIYVKGNPTLSDVRNIMIGIRNPKQDPLNPKGDDGATKCAEVWVNELRLSNFDKKGGWAATAHATAKLADIGNVSVAGTYKSIGFGSLEQKLNERRKSDEESFNVTSSLYLGKFLPPKAAIDIPMYVNYGQVINNPQFDPLDQDVLFKDELQNAETKGDQKEIKKRSQDYTRTKSINFTNVKKNRVGSAKPKIYDIENFNLTYGYEETYHRDINVEYDLSKTNRGAIGYNYNTTPKYYSPLAKTTLMKSKYLKLIKDVNINFIPTSLNFRLDATRSYGEKLFRNLPGAEGYARDTFFNKNFEIHRLYDFKYDITRYLKLDFSANNNSIVDQPDGRIDSQVKKDSIKDNILGANYFLGRNKQYQQSGNLSYQVPLNKFPLTDWISVNMKYGFNYSWSAGQYLYDANLGTYSTDVRTGNTIQNSNTKQLNGNFTLTSLYNKVPFLKKINSPKPPKPLKVKAIKPVVDPKAIQDTTGSKKPVIAPIKPPKPPNQIPDVVRFIGRAIMGVKSAGFTYSTTEGTILPGYLNYSDMLGQDIDNNSPGYGFVFGSQKDIREKAVRESWITSDTALNNPFANTYSENFTGRATIEPLTGLKVELTANRTYSTNHSEYFKYDNISQGFQHQGLTETGNFSISTITLNTAFVKDNPTDYSNSVFDEFNVNRKIISERLASENPNSVGFFAPDSFGVVYNDGYSGTQQEVLTLAFMSAYSGKSATSISENPFSKFPLPNWRITYDGLSKLPYFKKIFNSVNISHSYRSTFNINSFSRNLNFIDGEFQTARDVGKNFIARKEIGQVTLSEQFAPLLGIDVTWKNNIQTRVEFKRDRNVSLSYTGIQITEVKGNELTIGFGYRLPSFNLPFKINGKTKRLPGNSINVTADMSVRKNITIIRRLQEGINQPTAGLYVYSIKFATDYTVNERVNLRMFYEQTINKPVISTSYPTSNIIAGFEIRFSLSQ